MTRLAAAAAVLALTALWPAPGVSAAEPQTGSPAGSPAEPLGATQQDEESAERTPTPVTPGMAERLRSRRRPPGSRTEVVLRAEVVPPAPYVGQQTRYTVWLYTQHPVTQLRQLALPDLAGVWARNLRPRNPRAPTEPVRLDGIPYWRAPVHQRALFPLEAGRLELAPAVFELVVEVPEAGPFGQVLRRPTTVTARSEALSVEVRPLPEPPADFSGAVGQLDLVATLEPRELEVGAGALWTLRASGTANLHSLEAPALPLPEGLEALPPDIRTEELEPGQVLRQERIWTRILTPRRAGSWTLPAVELTWFDPESGRYHRQSTEPLALTALPAHSSPAAPPGASAEAEIRARKSWLPWLPWLAAALAALLAIGWVAALRHRRRGPRELGGLHAQGDALAPLDASSQVEKAWAAYLDRRWGIGVLSASQWSEALEAGGASRHAVETVRTLAAAIAATRQAPRLADPGALTRRLLEQSRQAASSL